MSDPERSPLPRTRWLRAGAVGVAFLLPVGLLSTAGDGRRGPAGTTRVELRPSPARPPGPVLPDGDETDGNETDGVIDGSGGRRRTGALGPDGARSGGGDGAGDGGSGSESIGSSGGGSATAAPGGGVGPGAPDGSPGAPPGAVGASKRPKQPGWSELASVASPRTRSDRFRIGNADTRLVFRSAGSIEIFLVDPAQGTDGTAGFAEVSCAEACDEEHVVAAPAGDYELEVRAPAGDFDVVIEEYARPS